MQFIHLTDLHYTGSSPFQTQLIRALIDDLKRMIDGGVAPDFVVFSGDLVNNPDEADIYAEFEDKFLKPVLEATLVAQNKVVFCPGNHDVSRKAIAEWADERVKLVAAMAISQQALHEHLTKEPTIAYARALSRGFFDLAMRYGHEWTSPFTSVYSYPERDVSFVAVNSGFACGLEGSAHDRGKLGMPAGLILKAFQDVPAGHKTFSLMHHTLSDLNEHSGRLIRPELFKFSSAHMFGHVHQPQPVKEMSPTGTCFTVQGGALYEREGQY